MRWFSAIAAATFLMLACGHMEATPRLKEAQAAYATAAQGPAAKYSAAELQTAKSTLDAANASLETGDRNVVDDKAALALSKTAYAESVGRTNQAAAERDAALSQLHITREQMLSKTQADLERERQARAAAEAQLAASKKDLEQYARVQDVSRGTVITLSGGVLFASGKSELLPGAQDKLNHVADFLKSSSSTRPVVIEGYTDSHGSSKKNQALSEKRAHAVADYLVSQGVPADRLQAVGKGEAAPVASNSTSSGRAENRRVEIVLQKGPSDSGLGGSAAPGSEPETQAPPPTTPR
jgi:outer membrane protein OmpA-like peptidoglycan-associated protein